jgi:ABC-type bacteriocin/lantibiotic exporter with double-glycine peptidase domain
VGVPGSLSLYGTATRSGLAREQRFLAETVVPADSAERQPVPGVVAITMADLSFAFPPAAPVLRIDSLILNRGEMVAVIGPSGGGKTTLGRLLRQFDPQEGTIRYNGHRLGKSRLCSLREAIAFCPQARLFFSGSVRDNLRTARPGASSDKIWEALRLAAVDRVVAGLERGLEEPMGPGSGRFSAGERQRLALARAVLQDAAVLILDEATSALDPATEVRVMENLRGSLGNKACLFITHRTALLRYEDRVVGVRDGRLVPLDGVPGEIEYRDEGHQPV